MKSDTALDYAIFQLSPKRTRCELFVSGGGILQKLASGLVKPFVSNLKVAEEQVARAVRSIKLETDKKNDSGRWFTKGTVERFVRFVSTPEVLELVNTFDAELSQLEAARRIYLQGSQFSVVPGEDETAADVTKKELLRAIDVRVIAVKQDLEAACAHAFSVGFTLDNVSELLHFADQFGADRLKEACSKFISLGQRQPDLMGSLHCGDEQTIQSSPGSDMSIDNLSEGMNSQKLAGIQPQPKHSFWSKHEQAPTHVSDPSKPVIFQPKPSNMSFTIQNSLKEPIRDCSDDDMIQSKGTVKADTEKAADPSSLSSQQPARRLSVQDHINMFEKKQKEQSGSVSYVGKNVVGGKVAELRRHSSDILPSAAESSVTEKAVLRRWSGASDTSTKLSGEMKDNDQHVSSMVPYSLFSSQNTVNAGDLDNTSQSRLVFKDDLDASQAALFKANGSTAIGYTDFQEQADNQIVFRDLLTKTADLEVKDQNISIQSRSFSMPGNANMKDQVSMHAKPSLGGVKNFRPKDRGSFNQYGASLCQSEHAGSIDKAASQTGNEDVVSSNDVSRMSDGNLSRRLEDVGLIHQASEIQSVVYAERTVEDKVKSKDSIVPQFQLQLFSGKNQDISRESLSSQIQKRKTAIGTEAVGKHEQLNSISQWSPVIKEDIGKKELVTSQAQVAASFSVKLDESCKSEPFSLHSQISTSGQNDLQAKKDQYVLLSGDDEPSLMGKNNTGTIDTIDLNSNDNVEPNQKSRLSKANQELNNELQVKAIELERLFAAHKQRAPGDQMASSRRGKMLEQVGKRTSLVGKERSDANSKQISSKSQVRDSSGKFDDMLESSPVPFMKMADDRSNGNSQNHLLNVDLSEDLKGKFYERYMEKRDTKLREESAFKKSQKEAKMKAMLDSFERSKAEMKCKFSMSADRFIDAHRRAERFKSLSIHSFNREQQHVAEGLHSAEDDLQTSTEETQFEQVESFNDTLLGDNSSRSSQSKKSSSVKGLSSSQTATTPIARSSNKSNNSISGKRRSENSLAQSVPNFSELRKENTKPSTGISKAVTRSQFKNYMHSNSSNGDMPRDKEGNPLRPHSMRRSSIDGGELVNRLELSATTNEGEDKESTDRKSSDETFEMGDFHADFDVQRTRLSQGPEKYESVSGFTKAIKSFSHIDDNSTAPAVSSKFDTSIGIVQDSLGGSPGSWNSRTYNAFSYANDASDVDASADSSIGSPASWNSQLTTHMMEVDAARMRKKWGSAQKPIIVGNNSHNARKDVTKGFKRLLKFGRKSRGAENHVTDWVSASTTSEGDDDIEDGRDPMKHTLEESRKTRKAFSHHSYDGFSEGENPNNQVHTLRSSIPAPPANFKSREDPISGSYLKAPRSFFSLSSFRSKGSESKPR